MDLVVVQVPGADLFSPDQSTEEAAWKRPLFSCTACRDTAVTRHCLSFAPLRMEERRGVWGPAIPVPKAFGTRILKNQ